MILQFKLNGLENQQIIRTVRTSWFPWEKLSRATDIPSLISAFRESKLLVLGPIVQMIWLLLQVVPFTSYVRGTRKGVPSVTEWAALPSSSHPDLRRESIEVGCFRERVNSNSIEQTSARGWDLKMARRTQKAARVAFEETPKKRRFVWHVNSPPNRA